MRHFRDKIYRAIIRLQLNGLQFQVGRQWVHTYIDDDDEDIRD